MKPRLLILLLACALSAAQTACTGSFVGPYSGIPYDFSIKPRPVVQVQPAK